jgi:hypothetical protein
MAPGIVAKENEMRLHSHSPVLRLGIAVIACAVALTPAAALATSVSVQAPAAKAARAHLVGCDGSVVRPTVYNPICNDGAGSVIKLHWSRWSGSAAGRGEFFTHTCVPSCATGQVYLHRVDVTAWRVRHGDYTRFRYSFPHSVPRGFSRSWTIKYYFHHWHGRVV